MCGILAFWSKQPINKNDFQNALLKMRHRGPDDFGIWTSNDQNLALGHVRLSVIDIANGHQPIVDIDNKIVISVNGEFYDYVKIRDELIASGYQFRTNTDSEILIPLYLKYGKECFKFLRGEFAFVLYDQTKNTLLIARDRFGIKPLYYTQTQNGFYIASEVKSLLALGIPAQWNINGVIKSEYLFLLDQQDSYFDNIKQLKPGHFGIIKDENVQIDKYWDFKFPQTSENHQYDFSQSIDVITDKLVESVKLRLKSDVQIGCYLSGGLDSSCIAGIAARLSNEKIKTFTIQFHNSEMDESSYAELMAKTIDSDHYTFPVNDDMLADHFEEAIWHAEAIMFNAHSVAKYLLSNYVNKNKLKVVLTGEGSDEIFGGYLFFVYDQIMYGDYSEQKKKEYLEALNKKNKVYGTLFNEIDNISIEGVKSKLGFMPFFLHFSNLYGQNISKLHKNKFANIFLKKDVFSEFIDNLIPDEGIQGLSYLNKTLYLWSKSHFPAYILNLVGDRMEMANSIEGRVPFLDHHLVEEVTKLPPHFKINGTNEKYILKKISEAFVPNEIINRQKQPFVAPPLDLSSNTKFGQLMGDYFHSKILRDIPFYDADNVIKFYNNSIGSTVTERINSEKYLLHILSMCVLQNKFNIVGHL